MDIEVKDKANRRHVGHNLQKIRVYFGMKQEALAADLGVNQQVISKIEKQEEIDLNELLSEMKKTDEELQQTQTEFMSLLKELTSPDEKIMSSLNNLIEKMEGR